MEIFKTIESWYKIVFLYNESLLNIFIKERENKIKFESIKVPFPENLKKYILNFKYLISRINQKTIFIELKEFPSKESIKYLILNIKNLNNENILTIEINVLNIEYYLIDISNNQRLNSNPFITYTKKDLININDILEIIDNEKNLNQYNIINFKYFNKEKGVFQKINKGKKILVGDKLILEFFITKKKDLFLTNIMRTKNYLEKEIIKLIKHVNIFDDITRKYDLIFLYASPIIIDDNYNESESPISYMEEIRIIIDLMKKKNKQFNCKFECINKNVLSEVIAKNKTKILHISAHGIYDNNNYSLVVENLQNNGKSQLVDINSLDLILNSGKINLRQFDLVILSTCYSENFAKKFIEYGAKNVIYIHGLTEVYDQISILFVKYFYENLIEGETIEKSFTKAKIAMKTN